MQTKVCKKCNISKPLDKRYFVKETRNKDGFSGCCCECFSKIRKCLNEKLKLQEKPRIELLTCTVCKISKPATIQYFHKHTRSTYGFKNSCKECRKIESHNWNTSERCKNKTKKRRKEDAAWKLRKNISIAICNNLKSRGYKKQASCFNYLGYTLEQLKMHLESQFEPWMNWQNWGIISNQQKTWNIDHIYPQSKLPYDSFEHPNFKKCWALENLRPLCAFDNIRKKDKLI